MAFTETIKGSSTFSTYCSAARATPLRIVTPRNGERFLMSESVKDEVAIRNLVEDWASAVRRKDLDAILLNHSPDMLMFDVPPPLESKGLEAYKKTWDLFFSWAHEPVVFDIREMSVTAGDDVAVVTSFIRCAGTEANGMDIDLDFRLTIGLRKMDNQWIITHEHHSIPAVE